MEDDVAPTLGERALEALIAVPHTTTWQFGIGFAIGFAVFLILFMTAPVLRGLMGRRTDRTVSSKRVRLTGAELRDVRAKRNARDH